jgi:CRP/FNR family transcriptional regulator, anaerobic regulatory protein
MTTEIKIKQFKKGTEILRVGEVSKYCFKVLKGCLKSFTIDNSGKENIIQFAPEDWWISDLDSFINEKPSELYISALEDTEVAYINKVDYDNFKNLSSSELFEEVKILTKNIVWQNKRLILLLGSTGEERYINFIQTYPKLYERLPLKMIASYIGVTPEHLSSIRKQLSRK